MTGLGVQADIEFRCDLGYATRVKGALRSRYRGRLGCLDTAWARGWRQVVTTLFFSEKISATGLAELATPGSACGLATDSPGDRGLPATPPCGTCGFACMSPAGTSRDAPRPSFTSSRERRWPAPLEGGPPSFLAGPEWLRERAKKEGPLLDLEAGPHFAQGF